MSLANCQQHLIRGIRVVVLLSFYFSYLTTVRVMFRYRTVGSSRYFRLDRSIRFLESSVALS